MSDRFPQYHQMIPNFNNPTPLQQQQQQQQLSQQSQHPQHPQQPDQHPAYPDQNRLWQQQMQFRPRSGMDINQQQQPQQPQQVQDMFRARHVPQNQQMGPQSQPQFGLGMSPAQMPSAGAMKPLPANQQQSFPDSAAAQPQPSHMQTAGFANMGSMPNQNPALNAASIPQRNSNIFVMQNGPMNKQLELMLAQQSANNVVFHPGKLNQQNAPMQQVQQQQPPSQQQVQTEMFPSPALSGDALRRPSPSHPPNMPPQMQAPLQGPPQHPVPGALHPPGMPPRRNQAALQEITERLKAARQNVLSSEAELRSVMSQMHTQPADVTQNIQSMQNDLKMKQEIFQQLQRQHQAFLHDGALANNGRMGPNNIPGQPPWGPQNGPNQNFENGAGMSRGSAHLQNPHQPGPQPPNGMQPNSIQPTPNNHLLASGGVPRQGPTPNPPGIQPTQQLGSPFAGQMNPANMPNKAGNFSLNTYIGANSAATAAMHQRTLSIIGFPPPLEKGKFNSTLPGFLQKRGIKIDPALLRLNDQQIDLANLHALVISEGGYNKVNENGLWDVIGGRMGFVNFPGSDHEPAKSGPVVAQNLAHVYREYLLDLESAYIRTWISNAHMRMGNPGIQPGGGSGGLPNGMGITANGQPPRFSPQLLQYANMSTAELRQRHVPDNVIAMVDQLRPQLQRTIMEQKRFQQQVRMNARNGPGMAGMPVDANGMQPQNQGTVMNDAGQQNGSAAMMLRQQMMKHPMMNGAGGMDARFGPFHAQYPLRNLEMTKNAMETINRMKEDCKKGPQLARFMQANIELPYDQQAEFNRLLDATYRQAQELDQKLHLLHVILPSCTQRVIIISNIIATQRQLKSTSQPRYILSLELLRNLATELQKIVELFTNAHMQKQYARMQQPAQQHPLAQLGQVPNQPPQPPGMPNHPGPHPHPQPVQNNMNGTAHSPPGSNMLNHHHSPMQHNPHQQHPPPAPQQTQQPMQIPPQQGLQVSQPPQAPSPSHMPSSRGAPINLQAPPSKRKVQNPATPSNTAPSPAAAVSTPAPANAPTPTAAASSPAAPKSPKPKPKPKQTTGKRKMSTAPNAAAASSSAPAPAPTQAPHEPAPSQPPTTNSSGKRPREEDAPSGNIPSPAGAVVDQPSPPKRSKMEWGEGPQSEELQQKKGQIENIKTEEDTSQFLEEFIKIVGGDPVRDTNGFAELSMLLKECTQPGPADDLSSFPPLEPPPMMKDELEQYFDFSLGGEDDDSKTPELVSSSSTTDTSPGSNSGNEPTTEGAAPPISNEIKNDESLDFAHHTHLGLWSGVDGGESAYYQISDWKFDSNMATQDPWAISTS